MNYTIITTAFNDEKNIICYLNNVTKQTLKPDEIVIADGGSKDETVSVVNEYAKSCAIPIRILSGKRLNIAEGFNEAIKAAKTEYVAVTGIGNTYEKDCFEILSNKLIEQNADFAYPPVRGVVDNTFTDIYCRTFLNGDMGVDDKTSLNHGVLIKKKVFEIIGYFYEKFFYAGEDSEFYALAYKKGFKGVCVHEAKLWWETPKNIKDLKRQNRVYTIGAMQIFDNKILWNMFNKRIRNVILLIVALVCLIITPIRMVGAGLVILMIAYCIAKKILRRRNQSFCLRFYSDYSSLYYMLINHKYLKTKNKVKRDK